MLSTLITSKTRLKLLLRLFSHPQAQGHLRGFAEELGESTNSVRIELSKLAEAGMLRSHKRGQKVIYSPNIENPFYHQISSIVAKHMGIDALVERILDKLGDLEAAYLLGDYALGIDSCTIELALVGEINRQYAEELAQKAGKRLKRKVQLHFYPDQVAFNHRTSGIGHVTNLHGQDLKTNASSHGIKF